MRLFLTLTSILFSLLLIGGCSSAQSEGGHNTEIDFRPNILWIVAEDLSPIIPPFGDSTITTPTLSRLAAEGVRYTHVFSPSGVCAPSRAAIALGMYQNHVGAHHMRTGGNPLYFPEGLTPYEAMPPAEVRMHSEYLREAGYYVTNNAKEDYQFKKPVTAWDESSRQAHWKNRNPGQPFFAIFNLGITHESQVWARANDSLWVPEDLEVPVPPYLPDNEIGQQDVRQVYSNIKQMDKQAGDLIAELEAEGLLDSTIVFWYSDHGGPLPRQKRLLYDSGVRVPMIIRFPDGRRAGEIDDQLISFIDFKPTIMSLAGLTPPAYLDGQAFLGPSKAEEMRTYIHGAADRFDGQYDMIRSVRDSRYKYMKNFQPEKPYYLPVAYREQMPIMKELLRMRDAGELDEYQAQWFRERKEDEELFDTVSDPYELKNLASDPVYSEKLAELQTELDRWMEEIDDQGVLPEKEFLATIWPDGTQPVTQEPMAEIDGGMMSLSSGTEGASIGYQIMSKGETEPGKRWHLYTGPFALEEGERVLAVAHRIGFAQSETIEFK